MHLARLSLAAIAVAIAAQHVQAQEPSDWQRGRALARQVCAAMRDPTQLVLIVREQRMFFSRPETGYRCFAL